MELDSEINHVYLKVNSWELYKACQLLTEVNSERLGVGAGQTPGPDPHLLQAFIPTQALLGPAFPQVVRPENPLLDPKSLQEPFHITWVTVSDLILK